MASSTLSLIPAVPAAAWRLTRAKARAGFRLRLAIARPEPVAYPLYGQNCTVLYTDVVGFARPDRTEHDRLAIRLASTAMTRAALASFADACIWGDRGDGMLIIVPPAVPTGAVLACLLRFLPGELISHNDRHAAARRIQLRVAVDVGPVVTDCIGVSGEPIIRAARMLEAPTLKRAMAATTSPLGVITSAFVFSTAVRNSGEMLGADQYLPVQVRVKEARIPAWFRLCDPVWR